MVASGRFSIEPLDRNRHDRSTFACGHDSLDSYLQAQAGQDIRRRVSAVFVAVHALDVRVLGYYSLAQGSVRLEGVPPAQRKRLPRYPDVPVTLLGRLAVDQVMQGRGLGGLMLGDACRRAAAIADEVAAAAVIVDAIDERAAAFYERFGFVRFGNTPGRLMLPMATIVAGLKAG